MTETDAEFALRSLAIEALAVCSEAGVPTATVTVLPSSGDGDSDWWKVSFETRDGKRVTVSAMYEEVGDEEGR